ncbi:MAG: FHA domain-containing protein [Betaproteobacteria bacterium]|nr:FHA domain-containing protein [Betaproteobacteria bacterium]MCL2886300.1 FHA domain-containing protein [Betaproteobacteria bacterium]
MAKLILSMDGLVLKEITLDQERLSIGRKPQNDIQIDNLAISGQHAVVVTILNDSFIEDLNSTNGTLINGQPVKKQVLRNNDIIELGKYRLKYMTGEAKPASNQEKSPRPNMARQASELELTPIDGLSRRPRPEATAASPEPAPAPHVPEAAMQVLDGPNAGKELALTKTLTTLGKPGQQVAVIARRAQGYFITHVEGKEFPLLNNQRLDAQAHPLADHDIVEIAGIKMEFFFKA